MRRNFPNEYEAGAFAKTVSGTTHLTASGWVVEWEEPTIVADPVPDFVVESLESAIPELPEVKGSRRAWFSRGTEE